MGQFEDDYIVQLHGVVTAVQSPMIILEYMPKGDLHQFLINLRTAYVIYRMYRTVKNFEGEKTLANLANHNNSPTFFANFHFSARAVLR